MNNEATHYVMINDNDHSNTSINVMKYISAYFFPGLTNLAL